MEKLKNGFFHNIMSVDETRVSVLMISLIGALVFGGYMYLLTGALSVVWADVITTLILAVAGINAVNSITTSGIFKKNTNEMVEIGTRVPQEIKNTTSAQSQQLKK